MFRRNAARAACWLWVLWLALPALALEPVQTDQPAGKPEAPRDAATQFIRIQRDQDDRPLAMQTAIVTYVITAGKNAGLSVDLIGAVHIGDHDYYQKLNRRFKRYDALLYELVAPEGTRVAKGGGPRSGHPIGALQQGMKDVLELEHQLSVINYQKKNFVHADMSPDEFAKSMADRDESLWAMFFRAMGQGIAQQSKDPSRSADFELLLALLDNNRALKMKRIMAEQFEDLETSMNIFDGPDGSTIITERNKVALKVLAEQIEQGKKHLGIFYGAGHMADMERRLIAEFDLKRQKIRWLTAWDMREAPRDEPDSKKDQPESNESR